MAVPKRKTSQAKTKSRRNHKKLGVVNLVTCSNCGEKKLPHLVCKSCGHYQGKEIIKMDEA
ncbi:MAG: large subunit ribosomal protein L32 [bacterium]|jgi:large subunit ribosomal protein L32